jgi:hypothetical protein
MMLIVDGKDRVFADELRKALSGRSIGQMDLVRRIKATSGTVSLQYICMISAGQRIPPPEMIDRICTALRANAGERKAFHTAAARDSGYQI